MAACFITTAIARMERYADLLDEDEGTEALQECGAARAQLETLRGMRDELARLRAELPSDGERAALAKLRELRAHPRVGAVVLDMEIRASTKRNARFGMDEDQVWTALAALLAPEGEVSRG